MRGLDKHGHQIALPLALRPALGIRVERVVMLFVATGRCQRIPFAVVISLSLEATWTRFLAGP